MLSVKIKAILAGGLIVSVLGASYALYQWGYAKGKANEADRQAKAVLAYQQQITKVLADLEIEQSKRQDVLTETREVIRYVQDPTGCIDQPMPNPVIDRLHSNNPSSR